MIPSSPDLALLANRTVPVVPRPPRRWKSRILLPLLILLAITGLLAYAARGTFVSRIDVWIVPVVAKLGDGESSEQSRAGPASILTQAPGWIEPSPYATNIAAFTEGVVREVLALEGQSVGEGEVIARLDSQDARLALRRVQAELGERVAGVDRAKADIAAAVCRVDELRDAVTRKRDLVSIGGVPAGEFAQLEIRVRAAEQDVAAAKASQAAAEAAVRTHEVMCDEAELALDRTEVRSPVAGIVLSRHVEPGTRIQLSDSSGVDRMMGTVLRVYDPGKLQVRADVPLADAAKIIVGGRAQVTTEALPDIVFDGRVILIGHEANIQRNTVPVKVAIEKPSAMLKPEMLARVRFLSSSQGSSASTGVTSSLRLLIPAEALLDRSADKAAVWVIDSARSTVMRREIVIGGSLVDGFASVTQGLQPGDRLIVDAPAALKSGSRVRIVGEKRATGVTP